MTSLQPRHIAIIMDGNRRWARANGLPVSEGYRRGVGALRRTVEAAARAGIEVLTVFAFSEENWSRPIDQTRTIMELCRGAALSQMRDLVRDGVRVRLCGRLAALPPATREALETLCAGTAKNTRITLNLAIDYGGRREIADAVRALAREVERGMRTAASIDDETIATRLYTAGLPDPDMVIRTGGERRISNFLLYQSAYAEFWWTETLWPDFGADDLNAALAEFAARQRRYGT
ncbi:MAG: di-trans,poly-cis-decaprenylcistransferase [Candidatus Eremiobacteraeota bacterium]|nr:di-trans,poly-cis-decaprenylcistransferase [Candidatus Eremiobacteraeota bacterium]MBV8355900.1 di-trans,poly-cis-decaprenylcistransferase [Candidatus Eremiobacteraeota bacterium]